ncbi:hypothetical protein [Francisella philomiragia]|uniref:hypothetical protein n=1 Tax=Francisella philomiragia TaxID=28110 RepID=UPI001B8B48C5|nr:hypothetical protein [Francisella philomiragia]QUE32439.1 hypothetical protein IMS64_09605 [Francisella philomiragia]
MSQDYKLDKQLNNQLDSTEQDDHLDEQSFDDRIMQMYHEQEAELEDKYGIVDYGTRLANKELIEGYKYINILTMKSPYQRIKRLDVSACLSDSDHIESGDDMQLVTNIEYTNLTYSFEDIENTIAENIDVIFDLAQQGEQGHQIIKELLNGDRCKDKDFAEVASEYIALGYTKFRIDRADGVNYVGMAIKPRYEGWELCIFKYKYHDPVRGPETTKYISHIYFNDDEIDYHIIEKKILDNCPYLFKLIRDHEEDAVPMIEEFIEKASKIQIDILPMPKGRGFWNQTEFAYNVGLTSPNPRADAPAL